ncbi:MAG: hypothetical protein HYY41_05715 [Chloroflexi bacterium]|nr:hypothetical protein [Chloroflexota bacterium]
MRNKWIKKVLPLSVMLVITLVFGSASPAVAAPVTTISLSGTMGNNDWYLSDVTVTLVATSEYSLNSGGSWQTYSLPFIISSEGTNTVLARTRDNAGNLESPTASRTVKIDKTAPVVTETVSLYQIDRRGKNQMVNVSYNGMAADSLSGLYEAHIVLIDEYGVYNQNLGSNLSGTFSVEAWCSGNDPNGRIYTFRLWATDLAGNQAAFDAETTILRK